jgi:hypothetical protein
MLIKEINENYKTMDNPDTYVPDHMRESFKLWIEQAISPGSFGMAVLRNDLMLSLTRADVTNARHLRTIALWVYNYAPEDCWGSLEKIKNWKGNKMTKTYEYEREIKLDCGIMTVRYNIEKFQNKAFEEPTFIIVDGFGVAEIEDLDLHKMDVQCDELKRFASLYEVLGNKVWNAHAETMDWDNEFEDC